MVQQVQQQVTEQRQQLEQARQAPQQLRMLQQQYETVQSELRFLERGVSEATYIPTMLKQIEQTARQLQLEIVAVRPQQNNQPTTQGNQNTQNASNQQSGGQATPKKAYEEQIIEVSLRGKFWSLMSFLKQLDEFPKILAVQTLNAQAKLKPEQEATNPDLEIRLTVKAFIFAPAAERTHP
jgi:Tfp pilus assembly protein PilO